MESLDNGFKFTKIQIHFKIYARWSLTTNTFILAQILHLFEFFSILIKTIFFIVIFCLPLIIPVKPCDVHQE